MAGGLTNLSKMPACNIMLLGAQRKTLSGFSSTSVLPHTGYIYHSDIVQSLPPVSPRAAGGGERGRDPAAPLASWVTSGRRPALCLGLSIWKVGDAPWQEGGALPCRSGPWGWRWGAPWPQ